MKKFIIGFYRKCDFITMTGTLFSFIGLMLVLSQHFTMAVLCMVVSGICDAFDGTVARMSKSTKMEKAYGVQLDSLSDVICFGVVPATITAAMSPSLITKVICAFYVLCGVIRLAYFNTLSVTEENKKGGFIGVPITTASIVYPIVYLILRYFNVELLKTVMPILLLVLGISFILKIHIPKVNVAKIFDKVLNKYVLYFVIFPLYLIVSGDLFYKLSHLPILESIKATIKAVPQNFLVVLLLMAIINLVFIILLCITKKSSRALITLLIISLAIMVISDIKYNVMGLPLEVSDVNYLNPANMAMMGEAGNSISWWILTTIGKTVIVAGAAIAFIILFKKKSIKIDSIKNRLIGLAVAIAAILTIFIVNENYSKFAIEKIYRTTNDELLKFNSVNELYDHYGFFQGMYANTLYIDNNVPEGYTPLKVKKLLKEAEDDDNSWGKANVVFVLSESFSNVENIDEVEFDKPLLEVFEDYENDKDKMVFDLLVPTIAGGSVNTEFEILTGASLSFWKSGYIPYNQYYNKFTGKNAPNIIKEFNNNGYETMYLTPWAPTSYKSKKNYDSFGTDRTVYNVDGEKKGRWLSDKEFMDAIYEELKDTSKGNYKFIMSATAQNHYPFEGEMYKESEFDVKVKKTEYSKEDTQMIRNYAQGIYDADKSLKYLYEKIQDLDTPTIVVFYGDHLPNISRLTKSGYYTENDEPTNSLRLYTTKAAIVANYDIDTEELNQIKSSYLGAYVLNKMDLKISDYFKFIDETREEIPVFNRGTVYKDGKQLKINTLDKETTELINNYKYVQYGSFYEFVK